MKTGALKKIGTKQSMQVRQRRRKAAVTVPKLKQVEFPKFVLRNLN